MGLAIDLLGRRGGLGCCRLLVAIRHEVGLGLIGHTDHILLRKAIDGIATMLPRYGNMRTLSYLRRNFKLLPNA